MTERQFATLPQLVQQELTRMSDDLLWLYSNLLVCSATSDEDFPEPVSDMISEYTKCGRYSDGTLLWGWVDDEATGKRRFAAHLPPHRRPGAVYLLSNLGAV